MIVWGFVFILTMVIFFAVIGIVYLIKDIVRDSKVSPYRYKMTGKTDKPHGIYFVSKRKPQTNAGRIRMMNDEELADEILSLHNWLNAVYWDDNRILNWLREKVESEKENEHTD